MAGEGDAEEVLVPLRCVVFDGLEAVVFKRAPASPDVVIRTPVDLGNRNDAEVEVLAGLMEGDEIVADGARQLKHATGGRQPAGGHFHADGTWHEDHK